jgi:RNA polymerase sigma-70 factor, ECF subfamily
LAEAVLKPPEFQSLTMEWNEDRMIASLAERDEQAFERVFKTHFKNLHAYACTMTRNEMLSEELVQDVFFRLWERPEKLNISGSISAYLYRSVYNACLNHLKHLKVRSKYESHAIHQLKQESDSASKKILHKELETKLHTALQELPEQCRTIFQLSRFEALKYREIADILEISPKTVENQMGKALKLLRVKLIDFLPFTIFMLLNIK